MSGTNGTTTTSGTLRPRYFDRQTLRAADLMLGQEYVQERMRRHNRYVHGWGMVCGGVVSSTHDPSVVAVSPGYGLTPRGDEVYIPEGVLVNISEGVRRCLPLDDPCTDPLSLSAPASRTVCATFAEFEPNTVPNPLTESGYTFTVRGRDGAPVNQNRIATFGAVRGFDCGFATEIALPAPRDVVDLTFGVFGPAATVVAFDATGRAVTVADIGRGNSPLISLSLRGEDIERLVITAPGNELLLVRICTTPAAAVRDVYLVACPHNEPVCPQPAVPAMCQPPGGSYDLSRVRETVRFEIVCELPESHQEPQASCESVAAVICNGAIPPCPPGHSDNCLVLATLSVGGSTVVADNFTHRRQLPSVQTQALHQRCTCSAPPPPEPSTVTPPTIATAPPTRQPGTTFTIPPIFTIPSQLTPVTLTPSLFTLFTLEPPIFTLTPSLFTDFNVPTLMVTREPGPIFNIDPRDFDLVDGARQPIERVPGIDADLGRNLRDAGVGNVLEFATMPVERASATLGVSSVRVAELQNAARTLMRRQQ